MTGEGIHTAMMGGKAAAQTIAAMRASGDFSAASCAQYERAWKGEFGHDFPLSTAFAHIIYRWGCVAFQ
jgi:flavin-dependent dehydrogenase